MFFSAKLKLNRANHHIHDLETQFTAFTDSEPYSLSVCNDRGQPFLRLDFNEPVPEQWALIIGDAIHNARTALDHMVWEIFGLDCGIQDRNVKLPTGDCRASFEGDCNGMRTPNQKTKDLLKALEVFPGGKGKALYSLCQFDNADKHTVLMPVIQSAKISEYVIYNADNRPHASWAGTIVVEGDTGHINLDGIPPGGHFKLSDHPKVTPKITLNKTNPEGAYVPVLSMLRSFYSEAKKAIEGIELSIS